MPLRAENRVTFAPHFRDPRGRSFLRHFETLVSLYIRRDLRIFDDPFHSTVLQHDATFAIFSTGQAVLPGRGHTYWSGTTWSGHRVTFAENPAPRGPENPSARADLCKQ